jgi:hypothetical protein
MGIGGCNRLCPMATGHRLVALFSLCPCRLGIVHCCGWYSGDKFIVLNTYLLMGAGRLITLLSWVLALFGLTD